MILVQQYFINIRRKRWLSCKNTCISAEQSVHRSRFGNFLCNNIHDRQKLSVPAHTVSLWAHLKADEDSFRNPTYKKYNEVSHHFFAPFC